MTNIANPVSYTHLDVYKRQAYLPADENHHRDLHAGMLLPEPRARDWRGAVSYTHLDVYKRQITDCTAPMGHAPVAAGQE